MELEDRITVPGAEGLDHHLVLAGLGSRGVAVITDLAIQTVALFVVALLAGLLGDPGVALLAVTAFLLTTGYPILFETFWAGQTPGKALMRISVVAEDGSPVTFLASVVRNLVRLVDALPGVYAVGIVAMLASGRSQRLGDLAAGTLVISRAPARSANLGDDDVLAGLSMAPVLSPEVAGWDVASVTTEEVAAIRTFLLRRGELDPHHRANLAQTLAFQVMHKVAGVPLDGGPEMFLERIVASKVTR